MQISDSVLTTIFSEGGTLDGCTVARASLYGEYGDGTHAGAEVLLRTRSGADVLLLFDTERGDGVTAELATDNAEAEQAIRAAQAAGQ